MGLSLTIFVPGPKEFIYMVCSCGLVYGLQIANLVLPLDLCAWMLDQLGTKVREASRDGSRILGWLGAKIFKALHFH